MRLIDSCLMDPFWCRAQHLTLCHIQLTFTEKVHGQLSIFYSSCQIFQSHSWVSLMDKYTKLGSNRLCSSTIRLTLLKPQMNWREPILRLWEHFKKEELYQTETLPQNKLMSQPAQLQLKKEEEFQRSEVVSTLPIFTLRLNKVQSTKKNNNLFKNSKLTKALIYLK